MPGETTIKEFKTKAGGAVSKLTLELSEMQVKRLEEAEAKWPGSAESLYYTGYISPEGEKSIIPEIPLRRIGKPEDIANAVLFFASEQANWITGQLLFVHGGHRMALGR